MEYCLSRKKTEKKEKKVMSTQIARFRKLFCKECKRKTRVLDKLMRVKPRIRVVAIK